MYLALYLYTSSYINYRIIYILAIYTSHKLNSIKIKNDKLYHFNKKRIYVCCGKIIK